MQINCISIEFLKEEWILNVKRNCGVNIELVERGLEAEYKEKIEECEVLICRDRDLSEAYLDKFLALKYIYIVSAGVEKIPFNYLKRRKINVINSGGTSDSAMSDYVIGAMLLFSCRFKECVESKIKRHWEKFLLSESLKGKKLLIVGAGKIGRAVAKKAKAMEMTVYGIKRDIVEVPGFDEIFSLQELEKILPVADYIVCTIPLTKETVYLFDKSKFSRMNTDAVFVNISRGKIVNEKDLITVLEGKNIKAAVLDVFETEPLPKESRLWELDNVVITPHSSGRIEEFLGKSMEIFSYNMNCLIENKRIPNLIDLEKGY